jgi:hypothetical protein
MTTDPDDNDKPEDTGTTQWSRERREMRAAWHGIPALTVQRFAALRPARARTPSLRHLSRHPADHHRRPRPSCAPYVGGLAARPTPTLRRNQRDD